MLDANALLTEYSASHKNPTNKLIHWFAVPAIYWSVFALIWALPAPAAFPDGLNWALIALIGAQIYYLLLSPRIGWAMLVANLLIWWLTQWIAVNVEQPIWLLALAVFVIAWIFQFVGHKIEGKKPAFLTDILFLLVGPAWCVNFLLGRFGVRA